jgi:hypothetical protein
MKTYLVSLPLMLITSLSFAAEVNPVSLRIGDNGINCELVWTNCACSSVPIYEVLVCNTPAGPWEHVSWITNATSFVFPNTNQARFFRIFWQTNDSRLFDFALYATNLTCPVITGWFNLDFPAPNQYHTFPISGSYHFVEGPCYTYLWSLYRRSGSFCWYNSYTDGNHSSVHLTLSCGADPTFFTGTSHATTNSSGCIVTQISGDAWQDGVAGSSHIGTFIANSSTGLNFPPQP